MPQLSVAQAAAMLGVHPQRVHQRIRNGSLPANKVGRQWVIELDDLHRLPSHGRPGRPLSATSAWGLIAVAAPEASVDHLSPSARSRARSRLRALQIDLADADLDEGAARLAHALGNRARRVLLSAAARDLPDIRADARIHLSGVSRADSNISGPEAVEAYVASDHFESVVEDYLLSPARRSQSNVIIHSAPSDVIGRMSCIDGLLGSPLVLAADLAEHGGARERNRSMELMASLNVIPPSRRDDEYRHG